MSAGAIAGITLTARAVGFGRWFVFSDSVGATCLGTAYGTANLLPNVLYEVAAGGALAAIAVPLVASHLQRGDESSADQTASALLTWAMIVLMPLGLLLLVLAQPIATVLTPGSTGCDSASLRASIATMLRLFAPQVVLYGLGIVLVGVLQAHRRFLAAAAAPLASSLVVIATYLAFGLSYDAGVPVQQVPRGGVLLLAVGTTLGVVALSVPLLWPTRRVGVRWRPTVRFPTGTGSRAAALAVAGLVAVGAQQVTAVATLWLANRSGAGTINVYTYVQTAYLLPYAVLAVPLATAVFPRLTDQDRERAARTLSHAVRGAVLAGALGTVLLVAVRREAGIIFLAIDAGAGSEGRASLEALPQAVAAYAPGLVGFALAAVLTRALYAAGSPRRAAVAVASGWLIAAGTPVLVLVGLGMDTPATTLVVLGVASAAGMTLSAALLLRQVRVAWGPQALRGAGRTALVTLIAGLAVLALSELAHRLRPVPADGWSEAAVAAIVVGVLTVTALAGAAWLADRASFGAVRATVTRRGREE